MTSKDNKMKYPTEKRMLWLSQVRSMPYRKRVELAAKNSAALKTELPGGGSISAMLTPR
ncbi:hypothetical protein RLEG3_03160 (plasmid) [Rhizobium leguminosarum bv. trifolii WSM1689]|nr:hypothetical protein RLEG3_03160 [Rhizobium leguminosarum bv. trifolii WSM1689]